MASRGMPFVSSTFRYTNSKANTQTTAKIPKTPASPMDLINTGRVYVMMMSQIQNVRLHMVMQMARTLVGKISAHKILGIGPNPMTKKQK